jgi:hypothetical protein
MMQQGVITGDIVNSTRIELEQKEAFFNKLEEYLKKLDSEFNTTSEVFRGDSFQCLVKKSGQSLKLALLQKTFIRSLNPRSAQLLFRNISSGKIFIPGKVVDARIAIGIGEIDFISNRLAVSSGKAFELSGQLLDKMKSKKQSFAISTNDIFNEELQTELILLDTIISRTTALQCEVINYKLRGYTEVQIAEQLKIEQSAVNHRSNGGNWNAIDAMLKRFEKIYSNE